MKKIHRSAPPSNRRTWSSTKRSAPPPEPDAAALAAIFRQCGIELTDRQIKQLWTYHGLLRSHNVELNLTRLHSFSQMVLKLYVDSVLPGRLIDLPSPLMDLGSGPGMPGIPLKIMHPEKTVRLAEGRGKRVEFLNLVVERVGLTGIAVIGRAITTSFTQPVAGVITRAVESMTETFEHVQGCLMRGGKIIFMKGPGCEAEIIQATSRWSDRFRLIQDLPYSIGNTANQRRLVVFERMDDPPTIRVAAATQRHRVTPISSAHNSRFGELKKLLTGRGLKKAGQALVAGAKPVAEILSRRPQDCLGWITREDRSPPPPGSPAGMEWLQLTPQLFDTLDLFGTRTPLLRIRFNTPEPWTPQEGFEPGCTLLIPFQDPENVGAVIRSAAAFGVTQVILLAESAHPYHPKALRAAAGSTVAVRLRQGPALAELPPELPVVALSPEGGPIGKYDFQASFGLLAGLEGPGLPEAWRKTAISIPIRRDVESLNAATATAIALYEWSRRDRYPL